MEKVHTQGTQEPTVDRCRFSWLFFSLRCRLATSRIEALEEVIAPGCGQRFHCYHASQQLQVVLVLSIEAVLLPLALSALHLFTQTEYHRLHHCKNERCILFF